MKNGPPLRVNKFYPVKVWISTVMAGPVIFVLFNYWASGDREIDYGMLEFILFAIAYGLLLSIPTFIFCYYIFNRLYKRLGSLVLLKGVVILSALAGLSITILIFWGAGSFHPDGNYGGITITWVYAAAILLSGTLIKVKKKSPAAE